MKKAGTKAGPPPEQQAHSALGSILDLVTGLLDVLAGTGHGVAACQQDQGEQRYCHVITNYLL